MINPNCNCGSTSGCERCNPDLYPPKIMNKQPIDNIITFKKSLSENFGTWYIDWGKSQEALDQALSKRNEEIIQILEGIPVWILEETTVAHYCDVKKAILKIRNLDNK